MPSRVLSLWSRKLHRWGTVLIAVPLLVVIVSGIFLQLKKESSWIQPPTKRGAGGDPSISFDAILAAARGVEAAEVESWDDVDRLDVRPGKGVVKVRGKAGVEVQVDTTTGDVLQVARRRSDLIEQIHDGSWFHDSVKLWVFLPAAIILFVMWLTGIYLWLLPHLIKRARTRKARAAEGA